MNGGAVRHGNSLREAREDGAGSNCPLGNDGVEAGIYICDVVGNGVVAFLARHPTRDYVIVAPAIEGMQRLDGDAETVFAPGNGAKTLQLDLGALCVTVEADEQRCGSGHGGRVDQIAAMHGGSDDLFVHVVPSYGTGGGQTGCVEEAGLEVEFKVKGQAIASSVVLGTGTEVLTLVPVALLFYLHVPPEALPFTVPALLIQCPSILLLFVCRSWPHWISDLVMYVIPILQATLFTCVWFWLLTRRKRNAGTKA